jgi:hypothetical protein
VIFIEKVRIFATSIRFFSIDAFLLDCVIGLVDCFIGLGISGVLGFAFCEVCVGVGLGSRVILDLNGSVLLTHYALNFN